MNETPPFCWILVTFSLCFVCVVWFRVFNIEKHVNIPQFLIQCAHTLSVRGSSSISQDIWDRSTCLKLHELSFLLLPLSWVAAWGELLLLLNRPWSETMVILVPWWCLCGNKKCWWAFHLRNSHSPDYSSISFANNLLKVVLIFDRCGTTSRQV